MINKLKYQTDFLFNYSVIETVNGLIDEVGGLNIPTSVIYVRTPEEFSGSNLRSDVAYFIDGVIDYTGTGLNIEIPAGGLYTLGANFNTSGLVCSDDNYTLFTSPAGGSGDYLSSDLFIKVDGSNSKVYDLTSVTGNEAVETQRINYIACSSRGSLTNYRQGLETGSGMFGGKPELTLIGTWNGFRVETVIVRGIEDGTTLFKAGTGLTMSGRFVTDINCDLAATGSLLDFSESNFIADESLVIQGAFITRNFVVNPLDEFLIPNISKGSIKSNWEANTGIGGTHKYIRASCSNEVSTNLSVADTFYKLNGTFNLDSATHFDMPTNGEFRVLTGDGDFAITGDIPIDGSANVTIALRIVKSVDNGASWQEINRIRRVVNNLSGSRDIGFFPINFITNLSKGHLFRVEVAGVGVTDTVTMLSDSFIVASEV